MSHEPIGPPPEHCGEDVAAYALGSLEPYEAEAFRRHLETCAVCPEELTSFQQVVDDLAISAPQYDAPPALRRRVMRAVADEPRLKLSARRERRRPHLELRVPRPALAWSLSAGLAVIVAAVLVATLALPGGSSTRTVEAQVTGTGSASLQVSHGHAQLVVRHLPAPPHGKVYEVWLRHGSAAPSPTKSLFTVNRDGDDDVDVPGSMHDVSQVLVTPEPAGGSQHPTHSAVISANLS